MIEVNIPERINEVTVQEEVYQWDYGQRLRITGLDVPNLTQVHFADKSTNEALVRIGTLVDDGLEVTIPDKLLENQYPINAYVYVANTNEGYTIKVIHIPVTARAKPETYVPTAEEQMRLEEMIEYFNTELEKNANLVEQSESLVRESNATVEEIANLYNDTITTKDLEDMINDIAGGAAKNVFLKCYIQYNNNDIGSEHVLPINGGLVLENYNETYYLFYVNGITTVPTTSQYLGYQVSLTSGEAVSNFKVRYTGIVTYADL